jgi:hypothetical protein
MFCPESTEYWDLAGDDPKRLAVPAEEGWYIAGDARLFK